MRFDLAGKLDLAFVSPETWQSPSICCRNAHICGCLFCIYTHKSRNMFVWRGNFCIFYSCVYIWQVEQTESLHNNVITTATTATKRLAFPVEWGISFAPEDLTDFAQRTCGHKMVQQRRCDKMCLSGTQLCACGGWRTGVLHLNQREYDYVSNCSDFRVIIFFYDGDSWQKLRHWTFQWALLSGSARNIFVNRSYSLLTWKSC